MSVDPIERNVTVCAVVWIPTRFGDVVGLGIFGDWAYTLDRAGNALPSLADKW
jgi:hypothetical protein